MYSRDTGRGNSSEGGGTWCAGSVSGEVDSLWTTSAGNAMTCPPARAVSAIRARLGNAGGAQEGPGFGQRDASTCPVSTEGWTRRVHFVREGGGRAHKVGARRDEAPGLRRGAGVEDEDAAGLLRGGGRGVSD